MSPINNTWMRSPARKESRYFMTQIGRMRSSSEQKMTASTAVCKPVRTKSAISRDQLLLC